MRKKFKYTMDKTVNCEDLSLVPEIRKFHPSFFHSFSGDPRLTDKRDSTDLGLLKGGSAGSPSLLDKLISVFKDNFKSFFTTTIIVLVILVETALDSALFKCPCKSKSANVGYSVIFITAPAVALLIGGILGNNNTWRLVTGCCYRTTDISHGLRKGFLFLTDVLVKALLAPFAWITYGFIDGRAYMCAVAENSCATNNGTGSSITAADEVRREGQMIGYALLIAGTGIALMGVLAKKSCSKYTYEQDDYIQTYRTIERVEMQKQMEAQATEVAHRVVRAFLSKQARGHSDWEELNAGAHNPSFGDNIGNLPWTPMQKIFKREHYLDSDLQKSVGTQTLVKDDDESDGIFVL